MASYLLYFILCLVLLYSRYHSRSNSVGPLRSTFIFTQYPNFASVEGREGCTANCERIRKLAFKPGRISNKNQRESHSTSRTTDNIAPLSFKIYLRTLGVEHPDSLAAVSNISLTYGDQSRTGEARAGFGKVEGDPWSGPSRQSGSGSNSGEGL